ncbi:MAG: SRPBCC domain-containing protein [Planctomycetota bacterium]
MNRLLTAIALTGIACPIALHPSAHPEPQGKRPPADPIQSRVIKTAAKERILVQEAWFEAPIEAVWQAYTTSDGWTAWASPKAEIDLRVGGLVRTHYDKAAAIGDPGTNTLTIVNYVPHQLLTLRADLRANWPEILKQDADNLTNPILFEAIAPKLTRVMSYGVGYRDAPEYDKLLSMFSKANETLLEALKVYLETGVRSEFDH